MGGEQSDSAPSAKGTHFVPGEQSDTWKEFNALAFGVTTRYKGCMFVWFYRWRGGEPDGAFYYSKSKLSDSGTPITYKRLKSLPRFDTRDSMNIILRGRMVYFYSIGKRKKEAFAQ